MIYLASPYTHDDHLRQHLRFKVTEAYTASCLRRGELIFSPIVYAHAMANTFKLPTTADYWEVFNREMITACADFRVLCLEGWEDSRGVAHEINLAKELEKVVEFVAWFPPL